MDPQAGRLSLASAREAPAAEPQLNRWGEFRDPTTEQEFIRDRYLRELRVPLRWSAWSVTLIYFAFGPIDLIMVPDAVWIAWPIRYAVAVPISLALAIVSMTLHAERFHRSIGVIHTLLGPALFITVGVSASDPGGVLYVAWGAVLFPLLAPQLTRLGVKLQFISSGIVLGYLLLIDAARAADHLPVELFIVMFFMTGVGYGAWATRAAEIAGRRSFWQERVIAWQMDELASEREKSERLLLNVLPASIAERLRGETTTIADTFEEVTVLFADICGFTTYSARVPAEQLVERLDAIFSRFDRLADELGLEKIKTIGDAYMLAGGLPERHEDAAGAVARMALAMRGELEALNDETGEAFSVRIGIHTGPVVAGVIGRRKFIYDLWGDTVNTASRMESHGTPGRIQLTESTARVLEGRFSLEERGSIEVKGKGAMKTYWLERELEGDRLG
jgi:class 3 adenylate cyclase